VILEIGTTQERSQLCCNRVKFPELPATLSEHDLEIAKGKG